MAGDRLLQQRALNGGARAAEMRAAEPPGQLIAELHPSDPFGASAAFPWPSCVHRSQALSPASRDAHSRVAPHRAKPRPHAWAQPLSGDLLAGAPVYVSCAHPACSCMQCSGTGDLASRDVGWGRKRCSPALGGGRQSWRWRVEPLCAKPLLSSHMVPSTCVPQQFVAAGSWGWQSGSWRGKLPPQKKG